MVRRKKHSLNLSPGAFGFNGGGGIALGTGGGVPAGFEALTAINASGQREAITAINAAGSRAPVWARKAA